MTYRDYLRWKMLQEMPEKDRYILNALGTQQQMLDEVLRRQGKYPFARDLLANVGGNFITSGLMWIGGKLLKRL